MGADNGMLGLSLTRQGGKPVSIPTWQEQGAGQMVIQPGRYRHYKGQEYEVIDVARHTETEEEFVVYRALYGERRLWIRPVTMFREFVIMEGQPCPRFQLITDGISPSQS
jgi:hypothetical protein